VNEPYDHDPWNAPTPPPSQPPPLSYPVPRPYGDNAPYATYQPHAPQQPEDPGPPPITPRYMRTRVAIAWTLIGICSIAIAVLQYIAMNSPELATQDSSPGFNTIYIGRMAVGYNEAFGITDPSMTDAIDLMAEESAYPLTSQMRAAIILAELHGNEQAQFRLTIWQPDNLRGEEIALAEKIQSDHALLTRIYSREAYVPKKTEADQLIEHHGWFGELAAGYNLPTTDPLYQSPRGSAATMVMIIFGMMILGILAFFVGLVLLVVIIVFLSIGKTRPHMPTGPPSHRTAYLELVALFLASFVVLQVAAAIITEVTGKDMMLMVLLALVLPLCWPLLCGVKFSAMRRDMGWQAPGGVFKEIGFGIVGYIAGLPIIVIGFIATYVLGTIAEAQADHPIGHEIVNGDPYQLLLILGATVVWAPLVEESIFRAAFYRHLRSVPGVFTWLLATVVTAFLFAAIHPQGFVGVPVLMSIAFVLAGLREWRRSLVAPITAHALHNGILVTMLLVVLYL